MRLSWLALLVCLTASQTTTTTTTTSSPLPCWSEAFPNQTARVAATTGNPLTCDICTDIFQGLDDFLLDNEDQVIYNLTSGGYCVFTLSPRLPMR